MYKCSVSYKVCQKIASVSRKRIQDPDHTNPNGLRVLIRTNNIQQSRLFCILEQQGVYVQLPPRQKRKQNVNRGKGILISPYTIACSKYKDDILRNT
jgi:hypothetical protein